MKHPSARPTRRHQQRGIVLIFALITLVIMLIGAVAISRSLTNGQITLGNIGFKRDLTNQGERAMQLALNAVRAGGLLATEATRNANVPAANYSASLLPTNAQGIPNALLNNAAFAAVGSAADIEVDDMKVTIRYVIDRMATTGGPCTTSTCVFTTPRVQGDAAYNGPPKPEPPKQTIFRMTLKVTGPRNTVSFFQSTFTTL